MSAQLIDSNILIDVLRNYAPAVSFIQSLRPQEYYISVLTIAELYAGTHQAKQIQAASRLKQRFESIDVSDAIAQRAGVYMRDYSKSHSVSAVDALIAATASMHKMELLTRNKKHFPMLKSVTSPY